MSHNILLFIDLDDTLFQTRRKNSSAPFPATRSSNPDTVSYMSSAQAAWFALFSNAQQVEIIPVTARDQRQYRNTFLSTHHKVRSAVLYFGAVLLHQGEPEPEWEARIQSAYANLSLPVKELHAMMATVLAGKPDFKLYNVDDYYVTVKASADSDSQLQADTFSRISELTPPGYEQHCNGRALSLLPGAINKQHAVRYLIKNRQADLTVGMGDSFTDWPFMHLCDFRVIPANSQLDVTVEDMISKRKR